MVSGEVGRVATQERVGDEVGVERGLELVHEITPGYPQQDLATLRGEARIARSPPPPSLLEERLFDGHTSTVPSQSEPGRLASGSIGEGVETVLHRRCADLGRLGELAELARPPVDAVEGLGGGLGRDVGELRDGSPSDVDEVGHLRRDGPLEERA